MRVVGFQEQAYKILSVLGQLDSHNTAVYTDGNLTIVSECKPKLLIKLIQSGSIDAVYEVNTQDKVVYCADTTKRDERYSYSAPVPWFVYLGELYRDALRVEEDRAALTYTNVSTCTAGYWAIIAQEAKLDPAVHIVQERAHGAVNVSQELIAARNTFALR